MEGEWREGGIRQEGGSRLIRLEAEHGSAPPPPERTLSTFGAVSMDNENRCEIWADWKRESTAVTKGLFKKSIF